MVLYLPPVRGSAVDEQLESFIEETANLTDHFINGIAAIDGSRFYCPLITQVEGTLWQGGTPATVFPPEAPAYFKYILNLYPWEAYAIGPETTRVNYPLYDSDAVDTATIYELAEWVREKRKLGPTLVHCQAGLNRSALVTALALMLDGRTADEAITFLRKQRSPAVLCNPTFEAWLRAQPVGPSGHVEPF